MDGFDCERAKENFVYLEGKYDGIIRMIYGSSTPAKNYSAMEKRRKIFYLNLLKNKLLELP